MDLLQKPQSTLKKYISKVSIRTVIRSTEDAEDAEPLNRSRTTDEVVVSRLVDARDPRHWPAWKKNLAFMSMVLSTAAAGILKTLFVTTNNIIATQYNVSYMAAAALTGVPFMVAAMVSLGSATLSQAIGKRTVNLGGTLLMLSAAAWNMQITQSYLQFMSSRVLQGVGWGALEGIVMLSVRDIFFTSELPLCFNTLSATSIIFTWGSPILGGYLFQISSSFRLQIIALNVIQAGSVFFALFFFPETSFKHPSTTSVPDAPSSVQSYLSTLHPLPYTASFTRAALLPIRGLVTPSAFLLFLLTGPITAAAVGLSSSLSLLFGSNPTFLRPSSLGLLFILPFALSLISCIATSLLTFRSSTPPPSYRLIIPATIVSLSGLLAFGLYTTAHIQFQANASGALFAPHSTESRLNKSILSLLFGLLAAGAAVFGVVMQIYLSPTTSRHAEERTGVECKGKGGEVDIQRACQVFVNILCGISIIVIPAYAQSQQETRTIAWLNHVVIGVIILQVVACVAVVVISWVMGERLRILDRRVLGLESDMDDTNIGVQRTEKRIFDA